MKTWFSAVAVVIASSALFISCGSKQETGNAPANLQGIDFPEWVTKGSGAFGGDKKAFFGVGSASGIRNQALAISTADNRGRNEIAKIMEVYSASLSKDYMASTTAGDMTASSEEQHVEVAIKTFCAQTLSGVVIVDHWFHPDGTVYSLAKLDLEGVVANIDKAKELSGKVRDYVRKNAERVHMDLEKEEAKHAGEAPAPAAE